MGQHLMLTQLNISNLSIIDKISLEFSGGLNIITGETGAGKSLVIQAVKLLVGERFSREMARDPEKKVSVEGAFSGDFRMLSEELWDEFEIEDEIVVKRSVDPNGKNKISLNGHIATLKQLKQIFDILVDFHGQHEHQRLLNSRNHIKYLDGLIDNDLKEEYSVKYREYRKLASELERLKKEYSDTLKNKDIMEFQLNEIESLNIEPDKDRELENRISFLNNIEKIREALSMSLQVLSEGEYNASDLINTSLKEISSVLDYYTDIESIHNRLQDVYYELDDCINNISHLYYEQDGDPDELDSLIKRKMQLDKLLSKYGPDFEDVLEFADDLKNKLDNVTFDEEKIEQYEKELTDIERELKNIAGRLNASRKKAARDLAGQVENILKSLELKDAKFEVNVDVKDVLDANAGADVEFYIATNKGFSPSPLKKVASGGELSRIMLALKEVFSGMDDTPTLIFDEIDTGISGVTARKVAEKLKNLGKTKQLFVITHLPVVASKSDSHFHIAKISEKGSTFTKIKTLSTE
ncbi:MAG TPA: DNA repair protein RecN, partial [Flexistipes sinusarabici]|nr:DNA repair protein RecN [Flexistipes sinusarabici]